MSTEKILRMRSTSSENTEAIGAAIGARLRGGEVIELRSDLGGGKTTLTRGLAKGAGSTDRVSSPTFTISKQYRADDKTLLHFDFYRLGDAGVVSEELREAAQDTTAVCIVEWGEVVNDVLPQERVTIVLRHKEGDERDIEIHCPEALEYLLEGVQ